ncbi:MAG: tail fiber domain-containing protein, partial [Flavobacteriaceae bacterium]|nr:tail fiber domain-containing protein [Flavobacteriaceae bacterium]
VRNNKSGSYGGGIGIMDGAQVTMIDSEISNNSAGYGGGIQLFGSSSLNATNTIFHGNKNNDGVTTSYSGKAILAWNTTNVTLTNVSVTGHNTGGSVIDVKDGTISVNNSLFNNEKANLSINSSTTLTSLGHNFSNDTTMSVLLNNESDVVGGTLTGTNLIYLGNNSNSNNFGNIQVGASNDNVINTSSGDLTIDSASGVTRVDDNLIVAGDINVNSDARLKANIISLGFTLGKLLQVDGKTYTFKDDKNHNSKIGLLAQDIEKVFPELVTETNGIKSVNYQGLIPVLINALKEQDEKMNDQQSQINKLENLVHELIK